MDSEKKEYLTIEELKAEYDTPDPFFEGVKAVQGWKAGKQVTREEYTKACSLFGNAAADGRDKGAKE